MIHSIYSFFILFIEANFSFFIYNPLSVMWRKIICSTFVHVTIIIYNKTITIICIAFYRGNRRFKFIKSLFKYIII